MTSRAFGRTLKIIKAADAEEARFFSRNGRTGGGSGRRFMQDPLLGVIRRRATLAFGVKGVDGDKCAATTSGKFPARGDERTRRVVVGIIFSEAALVVADVNIFADFKMEVGGIHAVRGADGADLLPPHDLLIFSDRDFIEMGVNGIHSLHLRVLQKRMPDDDKVAPAHAHVPREHDETVRRGINRLAQIGVAALVAIPIFAHVVAGAEPARGVVVIGIGLANRLVETIGQTGPSRLRGGRAGQSGGETTKQQPEGIFTEEPHAVKSRVLRTVCATFSAVNLARVATSFKDICSMSALTFLGTGSGDVTAGRFQSSILLECDEKNILLDAGEPCSGQLLNLGFALRDLDAVLITHAHADHTGGLPLLIQASWLHGRGDPLPLGLPAYFAHPLEQWLQAVLLPPEALGFPLEIFSWQAGLEVKVGGVSITPHRTTHLNDAPAESFLFEIAGSQKRIIYSGDLGSAGDLQVILDQPADVLICELAHLTPAELVAILRSAKIGTVCLTHLSGELDGQREEIKQLCENELSGTDAVYLPEDGERIEF